MMEEEEFQEADVLWPWPDTPQPSSSSEGSYDDYDHDLPAAAPELLYAYDAAAAVVAFSCEPFSEPAASSWSWSASSASSALSALLLLSSGDWSDDGGRGFFLSGASTVSAELDAAEESFLEADVLWPDTDDDDAAELLWRPRRSRRVEEAAAAAVFCGKREGCFGPLVAASSPIDIPMATRGAAAARRRRRP